VHGRDVDILKRDFPRPRVHNDQILNGPQTDSCPAGTANDEEAVENSRPAGQAADQSQACRPVILHENVRSPIRVGKCCPQPLITEGAIGIWHLAAELGKVMEKHQPEAFCNGLLGVADKVSIHGLP